MCGYLDHPNFDTNDIHLIMGIKLWELSSLVAGTNNFIAILHYYHEWRCVNTIMHNPPYCNIETLHWLVVDCKDMSQVIFPSQQCASYELCLLSVAMIMHVSVE